MARVPPPHAPGGRVAQRRPTTQELPAPWASSWPPWWPGEHSPSAVYRARQGRLQRTCGAHQAAVLVRRVPCRPLPGAPFPRAGGPSGGARVWGPQGGLLTEPGPARSVISSRDTIPGSPCWALLLLFLKIVGGGVLKGSLGKGVGSGNALH